MLSRCSRQRVSSTCSVTMRSTLRKQLLVAALLPIRQSSLTGLVLAPRVGEHAIDQLLAVDLLDGPVLDA